MRRRPRCLALLFLLLSPALAQTGPRFVSPAEVATRVVTLFEARLELMPAVAAVKWQQHLPIQDPVREQAVIDRAVVAAAELGLAEPGIRELFTLQIRLAREIQASLHERWRREGFDFIGPVPDLAQYLRPRLDQLTREQLGALLLATSVADSDALVASFAAALRAAPQLGAAGPQATAELVQALGHLERVAVPAAQRTRAAGYLRIGTTGDYAPFSLERDGELSGADIEMGQALAAALGLAPVFVHTRWTTLAADLTAGRFDIALGGIAITPARAAVAAFSQPYLSGGKTILSRCKESRRLGSLRRVDRRGVRVIVNPGGTNEQYVREHLHRAQVILFPDNRGVFEELVAGRADVMITDDTEVELQTRLHPTLCRALPGTLTHAEKAILTTHEASLLPGIDAWLAASLARGEPQHWLREALPAAPARSRE